ncbi:MAG TPA: hypothetical protein VFM18_19745 [Methanosarcina sp.]|nr:hypothetical protein [Methanosarcina sp.]
MEVIEQLPTLYQPSKRGAPKEWTISVVLRELPDGGSVPSLRVVFGLSGKKMQEGFKDVPLGKNIGKKNETTPARQAVLVAHSLWRKKKDSGYAEDLNDINPRAVPMLAEEYKDYRHKAGWPGFCQPKLEGIRCRAIKVAPKEMIYLSRKGKRFTTLEHLDRYYLSALHVEEEVDGELFNPEYSFQELVSYVKNPVAMERDKALVCHYAYDFPIDNMPFFERIAELEKRIAYIDDTFRFSPIVLTDTFEVESEEELMKYHDKFVSEGFEGTMFRNVEGLYRFNYRSTDLLKIKDFMDKEYRVMDVVPGEGRDAQAGTFVMLCTETQQTFTARPRGSWALRNHYLTHKEEYIGKDATIRFQRYTDRGIPYLPSMVAIRDYE